MVLAALAMLAASAMSFAGSDRLIMAMTEKRMNQMNLVYVRFTGPDGAALESDALQKMVIREKDCESGHPFEIAKDYKIGYAPKNFLAGLYLSPYAWSNRALCFSIPGVGKVEQGLDPAASHSRSFELKLVR
jgi:hypothetical protein